MKGICKVSTRNRKKGIYEPCGEPATYRVVVGSKTGDPKSEDTFYFCDMHIDDALIRARDAGYPIVMTVRIGK